PTIDADRVFGCPITEAQVGSILSGRSDITTLRHPDGGSDIVTARRNGPDATPSTQLAIVGPHRCVQAVLPNPRSDCFDQRESAKKRTVPGAARHACAVVWFSAALYPRHGTGCAGSVGGGRRWVWTMSRSTGPVPDASTSRCHPMSSPTSPSS